MSRRVTSRGGGGPIDSPLVHDEIRYLASEAKVAIQSLSRHKTDEAGVLMGVRQFGASEQSKVMLQRENEAALFAQDVGLYVVWRNESKPGSDFCARIGPSHRCFCGHTLSSHNISGLRPSRLPSCTACSCSAFLYVPNEPEEIGEAWLSRRSNWVPGTWRLKCMCGHSCDEHDPKRPYSCRSCRKCFGFEAQMRCVVCDGAFADHVTIIETANERKLASRPTGTAFEPLHGIDDDVRSNVLHTNPRERLALMQPTRQQMQPPPTALEPRHLKLEGRAPPARAEAPPVVATAVRTICSKCGIIFKTPGNFCTHCGAKR